MQVSIFSIDSERRWPDEADPSGGKMPEATAYWIVPKLVGERLHIESTRRKTRSSGKRGGTKRSVDVTVNVWLDKDDLQRIVRSAVEHGLVKLPADPAVQEAIAAFERTLAELKGKRAA